MGNEVGSGGAQTVQRAVTVLDLFISEQRSLRMNEIAAAIGLAPSTAHRIVRALVAGDLMSQDPVTRSYSLGPKILQLSQSLMSHDYIITVSQPALAAIRSASGETASLHYRIGDRRLCIAEMVSEHPIRMQSGIGRIYPLTRGAAGKAILAFLPEQFVRAVLSGPHVTGVPPQLLEDLDEIRRTGYATSRGETVPGAFAVAVPVTADGQVLGAINVTGPLSRFQEEAASSLAGQLHDQAAILGKELAGTHHSI